MKVSYYEVRALMKDIEEHYDKEYKNKPSAHNKKFKTYVHYAYKELDKELKSFIKDKYNLHD